MCICMYVCMVYVSLSLVCIPCACFGLLYPICNGHILMCVYMVHRWTSEAIYYYVHLCTSVHVGGTPPVSAGRVPLLPSLSTC